MKNNDDWLRTPGLAKAIASKDPSFYAQHYLQLRVPDHQKKWYSYLLYNRHLHLAPREHGKSIVFTRASPSWHLLFNKDYRMLLTSKTYTLSNAFLDVIENDLTKNPLIQRDFAHEVSSFNRKGNQIWCNREDYGIKEPSLMAIGRGNAVTSGHYDYHLMDDIIDDDSVRSQTSREHLIMWHRGTIGGCLAPGAKEHIVGTRKHPDDFYHYIMELGTYSRSIEKAIIKYPDEYEYVYEDKEGYRQAVGVTWKGDYEILWEDPRLPYAWSLEKLLMKKQEMQLIFEREFQNNTAIMEGSVLKPEWLHYYTTDPSKAHDDIVLFPPGFKTTIQGWDFAISLKEEADFTVCCTLYQDPIIRGRCYAKFFRGKWEFPTVVKLVEKMFLQTHPLPSAVGMEAQVFQKGFRQTVQTKIPIPAVDIDQTKDKIMRISSLAPYFENGTIYIDIDDVAFFNEYIQFPTALHDDMLDALEIAMRCLLKRGKRAATIPG
jgi:predicted phage terminase large subunit-like protein